MTQQDVDKIERTSPEEDLEQWEMEEFSPRDGHEDAPSVHSRLIELEAERLHLQRLVAELLMKNQKLRDLHRAQAGSSASTAATCGRHDAAMDRMHPSIERAHPSPR